MSDFLSLSLNGDEVGEDMSVSVTSLRHTSYPRCDHEVLPQIAHTQSARKWTKEIYFSNLTCIIYIKKAAITTEVQATQ
jgi:hypothetical protein